MLLRRILLLFALVAPLAGRSAESASPAALVRLVIVADVHSAYARYASFLGLVEQMKRLNPEEPIVVLINGDLFEHGNALSVRTQGALDFAWLKALSAQTPVVMNLGNHEADLFGMAETVQRLRAAGVAVVCGNLGRRHNAEPLAPPVTTVVLAGHAVTFAALTTDHLATYRAEARSELQIAEPAAWAGAHLGELLRTAEIPVVASHAGFRADQAIAANVPPGALFVGGHDHLRFIHRDGRGVYLHPGSWLDSVSIARLRPYGAERVWEVSQQPLRADWDGADAAFRQRVEQTFAEALTPAEKAVVGHTTQALGPAEAATFAVQAVAAATKADLAVVGGTTFGGGLPRGAVTRYEFDDCVRFDGPLYAGEVDAAQLRAILARANQGADTPFAARSGEILVAAGPAIAGGPAKPRYRLVTTDWIARNPKAYFGENAPGLHPEPSYRLKPVVLDALR